MINVKQFGAWAQTVRIRTAPESNFVYLYSSFEHTTRNKQIGAHFWPNLRPHLGCHQSSTN